MTTGNAFARKQARFTEDVVAMTDLVGDVSKGLTLLKAGLDTPAAIAAELNGIAAPLDLPKTLITPLSAIPYGIGRAVKTFDRVAGTTVERMNEQADILWDLDIDLRPAKNLTDKGVKVMTAVKGAATALSVVNDLQTTEAENLKLSLGSENVDGTRLGFRMDDYKDRLDDYFALQDSILDPLRDARGAVDDAARQIANLMPDLSLLDDAGDVIDAAFAPIKDAFTTIETALFQDYTVIPAVTVIPSVWVPRVWVPFVGWTGGYWTDPVITPAVVVNPGEIIATIGNAIAVVQNFVEDLVLDLLAGLGFDLNAAVNSLGDKLLAPLQPIFDIIDDLRDALQPIIDRVSDAVDQMTGKLGELRELLENMTGLGSIFDNTITGDQFDDPNDVLVGTAAADAIFGLTGNDTITAVGEGDILLGGVGDDSLTGGSGTEMFGGDGDDILRATGDGGSYLSGGRGDDRVFGGDGVDTMTGGNGDDTLNGGHGHDEMAGGKGSDLYIVRSRKDRVEEEADAGIDIVRSRSDYELSENVERLILTRSGDRPDGLHGVGNAQDNFIKGSFADDRLDGGGGADRMRGRDGDDAFIFREAFGNSRADSIVDFNTNGPDEADRLEIALYLTDGSGLNAGTLAGARFTEGLVAGDANDRFVFHQESGRLWFDEDGTGIAGKRLVARFENDAEVQAGDIVLF
ncbi:hypothetical protein MWU52_17575 [Jannaschia sp. S6380]|uniref:calcium-binding protein n=1 Tax=Jannaschia sp. S6380 TaxID=2926408 RepID=UPI001FF63B4D|nr:calcium-binding protein [Jannaschia sp. S6380]MCK0169366.1 hypothetical protein [Jannaschia sp. S6380]